MSMPGSNTPASNVLAGYNEGMAARLASDYASLFERIDKTITAATELPMMVENSAHLNEVSAFVQGLRDLRNHTENIRVAEKAPYLRGGDLVDATFRKPIERIDELGKILKKRVDEYKQRQLLEERRRREAEAAAQRAREEEATRARELAERARQAAEAAAAKAKTAKTQEKHNQLAEAADVAAAQAAAEENLAGMAAEQAEAAAKLKAADIVRERFQSEDRGGHVTMRTSWHVEITDVEALDLDALRPYISEDALLKALKAWARVTGYKKPMDGALIEARESAVIR